jgi:transcriptional regulator of acetoin/glycerol metabolism
MTTNDVASIELFDADGHLRKLSDIEADVIALAVNRYGGSVSEVSRRLCIGRTTLYRRLERIEDLNRRACEPPRIHRESVAEPMECPLRRA